jgi:UDP-glucose 4-epimerase
MGVEPNIQYLEARKEALHAFSDHENVKLVFGDLIKNVPLEEGVARMADWAKGFGARRGQIFENIEVEKNMPPSWQRLIQSASKKAA